MTRQHGKHLPMSPGANAKVDWVAGSLAVLGVSVSTGLIIISAVLNYRMGYRSADTAFDGYVYGIGAACGDALKAISPFMAFYGLKNRDWLAVLAATAIYVVFTGYSFFAALGFAAEHRTTKAAATLTGIENRQNLRQALARDNEALDLIGNQRSSSEVEAAIVSEAKKTVGPRNRTVEQISNKCTLNREATREACRTIASLGEELARAGKREALLASNLANRKLLADFDKGSAADSPDPQVDAVKKVVGVIKTYDSKEIGFGLSLLLALFIELGSGLGLFVATTPWRARDAKAQDPEREMRGPVDVYVLDTLEPDPRSEIRMTDLYASYRNWCRARHMTPHPRPDFKREFTDIAREVGMRNLLRGGQEHFQQVRLGKGGRS